MLLVVICYVITLLMSSNPNMIIAKNGVIDFKNADLTNIVNLDGEWQIACDELISPSDFDRFDGKKYIRLPSDLSKNDNGNFLKDGRGVATLKLTIKGLEKGRVYGISIPYFSSSNKVWIDRKMVSETGKVDIAEQKYEAKYVPREIFFEAKSKKCELLIQVANFHHRRIRLLSLKFGTSEAVYKSVNNKIIMQSFTIGSLMIIAAYYSILYKIQKREKAMMYLAIIAFSVAIREMIVHERVLIRLFPDFSAEWMMKLGFLPVFIVLPFIAMYIQDIFKVSELEKFIKLLKIVGIVSTILIVVTNVKVYDFIFEYCSFLILIAAAYLIYIIVSKKLIRNTKRAETMALGSVAVLIGATNDVFRELGIISTPEMLSGGIVIFILLQAVFLAWRFNDSFEKISILSQENEAMYEELQELNSELEEKISQRTDALERANRELSRLSIKDPLTGIGNRRYCDEKLKQCWKENVDNSINVGLIMIDIDYFKKYNDFYGHIKGDWCLKMVAKTLRKSLKDDRYDVTRYGGEEFLVIMPKVDENEAISIAEKIRDNIGKLKIEHKNSKISENVTISMGLGIFSKQDFKNEKEWVEKTDELLYLAKQNGRNQFKIDIF